MRFGTLRADALYKLQFRLAGNKGFDFLPIPLLVPDLFAMDAYHQPAGMIFLRCDEISYGGDEKYQDHQNSCLNDEVDDGL